MWYESETRTWTGQSGMGRGPWGARGAKAVEDGTEGPLFTVSLSAQGGSGATRAGGLRQAQALLYKLRQRKLVQWVVGYVASAWFLLELTQTVGEIWEVPLPLQRAVSLLLGFGLFIASTVAWYHGEKGRQRVCVGEIVIVMLVLLGAIAAVAWLCV